MRAKYSELIQDYEFYVLTGERFDDALLQSKPSEKPKSSKRAIKCSGRSVESYAREEALTKRQKVQEKVAEKEK
jgi:hypothetical protein